MVTNRSPVQSTARLEPLPDGKGFLQMQLPEASSLAMKPPSSTEGPQPKSKELSVNPVTRMAPCASNCMPPMELYGSPAAYGLTHSGLPAQSYLARKLAPSPAV